MNGYQEFSAIMYVLNLSKDLKLVIEGTEFDVFLIDLEGIREDSRDFMFRLRGKESKYVLMYRIYDTDDVRVEYGDDTNTFGNIIVNRNGKQMYKFGWLIKEEGIDKSRDSSYNDDRSIDQILQKGA